ncbi:MAG: translocation/assembly module TamB domain-containing protein [Muribaculaceae bacterium]|nr:translocation/assembly module TamB domain-containing protein [Muribaculaceae bacterium]
MIKWTLLGLLAMVVSILLLIYLPFVQDWAKDIALAEINKSTGMTISVERLRLLFPLDVAVDDAVVLDEHNDTMVSVGNVTIDISVLPLFKGDVVVDDVSVENCRYRMGNRDSVMYLNAVVSQLVVKDARVNLVKSVVNIDDVELDGADIDLSLKKDTTETAAEDATAIGWMINAKHIGFANVDYCMSMDSVADFIGTNILKVDLDGGVVDMTTEQISIMVQTIALKASEAKYIVDNTIAAQNGLDLNYLQVNDISLDVDSFLNQGAKMRVPLTRLSGMEHCGVSFDVSGEFLMDSVMMTAKRFNVTTAHSSVFVDGKMGIGGDINNAQVALLADVNIGLEDIEMLYPALKPVLAEIPRQNGVVAKADVDGTMSSFELRELLVSMPHRAEISMSGHVKDMLIADRLSGDIEIEGDIKNVDFVETAFIEGDIQEMINIPPLTLDGNISMQDGVIAGLMQAVAENGRLALDAKWNSRGEEYDLTMAVDSFPVNLFLPTMGIGALTADVEVSGKEYNPMSPTCTLDADVLLKQLIYRGKAYHNARAWANLANSEAEMGIVSLNNNADFDVVANATIKENEDIEWRVSGDVRNADLKGLGLSETQSKGSLTLSGDGVVNLTKEAYDINLSINQLEWSMPDMYINTPSLDAKMFASDSIIKASINNNNDLKADFISYCSIDTFVAKIVDASAILDSQIVARRVDVSKLQRSLPGFELNMTSKNNNILNSVLSNSGMGVGEMSMSVNNDSVFRMKGDVLRFNSGDTRLDTLRFDAWQQTNVLNYTAMIGNRPGTLDKFAHVDVKGAIADDKVLVFVTQRNIAKAIGFNLGATATIGDTTLLVQFVPVTPIIGYKNWEINEDNYLMYNLANHHIDAKMLMSSDDSHLNLYTEHTHTDNQQEDIVLNINNIKLSELMSVSPFAPPIKGVVSTDMRFHLGEASIRGNGVVSIDDMYFGRDRVGSFQLGVDLNTDKSKKMTADVSLLVDGVKTITATGSLNDTTATSPINLDFSMIKFPLHVLNPFLPRNTAKLSGLLNGEMDVTGDLSSPKFNGYIDFDTTAVKINMIGSSFYFSEDKVPVKDNVITFSGYEIKGANDNPLTINGVVDMGNIISPKIDLTMRARNMQFMNSSRGKGADVYGKGFINLDAGVKGDMSEMDVDASLTLLGGSNITYIMTDATSAITSQSTDEMVKFVQFSDTIEVAKADTVVLSSMALNIDALLKVSSGTTINVDLSTDGKNRVQLQGNGTLNYTMNNMADSRFTGRYNIDKGFVRYTPPLMSEKLFNFKEGSYVAFNGDILNPILNIHAVDDIKANVTKEGQNSRLVNFDVSLSITNTLSNMNVVFDMAATDDISIQNELQSMSAEQRANQAMNLLLYNVYTGPSSDASASMSGNPLYSFLESQINSWAANNIKFVDISFGIDQYDKTLDGSTTSTTNYSYKVSKTLFNDRFKIVIGGNYSTDVDADEDVAQNLINDISFEYMLNRSGSMYVKIFRHVGYEILEGEITQTGVGFVYKRKIQKLSDLFRFGRRPKRTDGPQPRVDNVVNQKADGKNK